MLITFIIIKRKCNQKEKLDKNIKGLEHCDYQICCLKDQIRFLSSPVEEASEFYLGENGGSYLFEVTQWEHGP